MSVAQLGREMSDNTPTFTFTTPTREWLRIVPSENGWDVVIPEDVTLTQAAQMFIQAVNELKSKMQPTVEKKEWSGE